MDRTKPSLKEKKSIISAVDLTTLFSFNNVQQNIAFKSEFRCNNTSTKRINSPDKTAAEDLMNIRGFIMQIAGRWLRFNRKISAAPTRN